jgi:hypothetical protein
MMKILQNIQCSHCHQVLKSTDRVTIDDLDVITHVECPQVFSHLIKDRGHV